MNRESQHEAFFKVLRILTACVSEAPYAADERGFFQAVCNTLVRSALFQFAWFGYASVGRIAEPIAWAGHGFLEDLKLALNQDDYEDPANVCLRTGDACWIKDIAAHPGMGPIRATLLRCGYTSILSAPVVSKGSPYAALTLYYDEPEAFGQDVVNMVKEKLAHLQAAFEGRPCAPRPRSEELEAELRSLIDAVPINVGLCNADGMLIHINRRQVETTGYTLEDHVYRGAMRKYVHPDDVARVYVTSTQGFAQGTPFEFEVRHLRTDNQYHWVLVHCAPIRDEEGRIVRWCFTGTDIQQLKQVEEHLRQSEVDLLEAQRISHTGNWKDDLASGILTITPEMARVFGLSEGERSMTREFFSNRLHPEDRAGQAITYQRARETKADFESDYRIVLSDDSVSHIHNIGHPKLNEAGELVGFVGTIIDVTEATIAEQKLRQSAREARQILDLSPIHLAVFGPDVARLYANRVVLDHCGLTLEEWRAVDFRRTLHPKDAERAMNEIPGKFRNPSPFEYEVRLKRRDGTYRWFHFHLSPMLDEQGCITSWYSAGSDIEDHKLAEQRLRDENVSLREEIDKASMFEEIVGTSAALKKVVSRISKVAPADSSVLISGETGTGKELVARAIHRRSQRSSHAFVSVNCAAIPRDLIASELFGHEKGAFTGATQRRLGRFELAAGGTIFLDEVGELPAETQITLLRVLQERELERVGGNETIRSDVRVIAATNRDLETAIALGEFRSDLYYRLNVFPIEMPPLRERREDIPLLVEYFLDRYARKAGKSFRAVNARSLDLLRSYSWPGNIRELQNVIERSVIVSETENFSIDESWLSRQPPATDKNGGSDVFKRRLPAQEKTIIEAALRECGGRVSGPSGAAAKLGMPRSTLESKIRSLKINKHRFHS